MWLIIATVTYILLQVWSLNYTINDESFITKIFTLCVANAIKVGLGFSGIATAYIATLLFLRNRSSLGPAFIILSTYCYGVYIFHQFLLKALYYHTSLPAIVSIDLLPWVCIIITVILSLVLVFVTLKTRIGRFLIG